MYLYQFTWWISVSHLSGTLFMHRMSREDQMVPVCNSEQHKQSLIAFLRQQYSFGHNISEGSG